MSKRLTKTIWYGSDVDSNGNPILPSTHGGLDGLNYGELYLHLSNGKATLWTLSSDGKIVEITGGGSDVDMSSYLLKSIWDKVWEIRTDSQGTEYIFGKLPVVTQYGITMYSGDGVDVPSLASGLPFDGRTIWYNPDTQQIEVIGGTGGGSGEGVSNFWDLSGIPSWITNNKPEYSYSEIEGTPDLSGYATESWVLGKSYITPATLGVELEKYVTLDTDQLLNGKKDFKNGLSIGGLELRKSQDDVVYIDANLVVRGGVTMYAQNEVDIPSIIDSIPTASTTAKGIASFDGAYFSVVNGKVSLIASNVGLNEEELYNYLTSNNYAKKSDIPSLAGYATESWVNTRIDSLIAGAPAAYDTLKEIADVLQGNVNSIGDIITALGTKWTQDNTKIANWDTAYSWGNHANAGYALKTYVDSELTKYVTLGGTQTITGEKNFTGGLKVNGSPIVYDATKKYWKLEGDLLVTGGVTMYGSDSSFTPSTIMDAIAVDGTTISKSGGVLKVIGGTGGGVADSVAWANITGKPTFATVATSGKYSDLSGTPSSLPASDVYSWAKAANKPSYTWSEITSKPTWITNSKPSYSYSEITGAISTTELQNYLTSNSYINVTSGDNRYLKLSGGTLTLPSHVGLVIKRTNVNSPVIAFYNNDELEHNYIGFEGNRPIIMNKSGVSSTIWHSGNDGSGSGLDADLLDGVQESGFCRHFDGVHIESHRGIGYAYAGQGWIANGPALSIGYSGTNYLMQLQTPADYTALYFRNRMNGAWSSWKEIAFTDSNVASATKLQTARTIWGQSFDGTGNVDGDIYINGLNVLNTFSSELQIGAGTLTTHVTALYGTEIKLYSGGAKFYSLIFNSSGNVGIGTTNPAQKLHIVGRAKIESSDGYALEVSSTSSTGSHVLSFNGTGGNESAQIGFGANGLYAFNYAAYRNNSNNITAFGIDLNGIFYLGYSGNPSATNSRLTVDGSGNLLAKGGITMYSQKSLKNIQDERGLSLAEMSIIKPTRYTWKDGRDNRLHFGGIADDIQQVLPEVVYSTSDGILTMDYGNAAFAIASSLIQPVVDHEKRIAMLQERIVELEEEVERLKSA